MYRVHTILHIVACVLAARADVLPAQASHSDIKGGSDHSAPGEQSGIILGKSHMVVIEYAEGIVFVIVMLALWSTSRISNPFRSSQRACASKQNAKAGGSTSSSTSSQRTAGTPELARRSGGRDDRNGKGEEHRGVSNGQTSRDNNGAKSDETTPKTTKEKAEVAVYVHYTKLIGACAKEKQWQAAFRLLDEMRQKGYPPNQISYCAAIDACAKSNEWQKALELLDYTMGDGGVTPDVILFNAAISACASQGQLEQSLLLLRRMQTYGLRPNMNTCNAAINACAKGGQQEMALELLASMGRLGLEPNVKSFGSAINACAKNGDWEKSMLLLQEMEDKGITPNVTAYSAVINSCAKGGRLVQAEQLLHTMEPKHGVEPNLICWSATINAAAKCGRWEKTVELLEEMQRRAVMPDEITYTDVIHTCDKAGEWRKSVELINDMRERGLHLDDIGYLKGHTARWGRKPGEEAGDAAQLAEKRKSRVMCKHFKAGFCRMTEGCHFRHDEAQVELKEDDQSRVPGIYKTKMCQYFQQNRCAKGTHCTFAHDEDELHSALMFMKHAPKNNVSLPDLAKDVVFGADDRDACYR